jgi:four helix bundle protein
MGKSMDRTNFEKLQVYQLAEQLSDNIWGIVYKWHQFARDSVGKQIITAADSIGANIAEGAGRGSFQDNRRFVKIARGSLNETKHWLRRAYKRSLLTTLDVNRIAPIMDELAPRLNAYLKSIGNAQQKTARPRTTDDEQLTTNDGQRTTDVGQLTTDKKRSLS